MELYNAAGGYLGVCTCVCMCVCIYVYGCMYVFLILDSNLEMCLETVTITSLGRTTMVGRGITCNASVLFPLVGESKTLTSSTKSKSFPALFVTSYLSWGHRNSFQRPLMLVATSVRVCVEVGFYKHMDKQGYM